MRASASFPQRILLYNLFANHSYRMELREPKSVWTTGNATGFTTESAANKAFFLPGPLLNFGDGRPPDPEETVTLKIDDEIVLKEVHAAKFIHPEKVLMDLSGLSHYLFPALPEGDVGPEPKKKAIGLFLPNGSRVHLSVKTTRKIEIGLPMAEYEALQ